MKCRMPVSNKLKNVVKKEIEKQRNDTMRRFFKIMCIALNEEFGFGEQRLKRLILMISQIATEHEHDEVYWEHIDMRMEQMNIEFEVENYNEL